jgi:hypothetical protein
MRPLVQPLLWRLVTRMLMLLANDLVRLSLNQQWKMAFLQSFSQLSAQTLGERWPFAPLCFTFATAGKADRAQFASQ